MKGHQAILEALARRTELTPLEEMTLREHLRTCPSCAKAADAYARQTVLLRSIPVVDPPTSLRDGVLERIRRDVPPARAPIPFGRRPVLATLALAAAAVLAIIGVEQLPHAGSSPHAAAGVHHTPVPTPVLIQEGSAPKASGTRKKGTGAKRGITTRRSSAKPAPIHPTVASGAAPQPTVSIPQGVPTAPVIAVRPLPTSLPIVPTVPPAAGVQVATGPVTSAPPKPHTDAGKAAKRAPAPTPSPTAARAAAIVPAASPTATSTPLPASTPPAAIYSAPLASATPASPVPATPGVVFAPIAPPATPEPTVAPPTVSPSPPPPSPSSPPAPGTVPVPAVSTPIEGVPSSTPVPSPTP
jgi:hypothetical protein